MKIAEATFWIISGVRLARAITYAASGTAIGVVFGGSDIAVIGMSAAGALTGKIDGRWQGAAVAASYLIPSLLSQTAHTVGAWDLLFIAVALYKVGLKLYMGRCCSAANSIYTGKLLSGGLFGVVRHPLNALDILAMACLVAACPTAGNTVLLVLKIVVTAWVCVTEETFLSGQDRRYKGYTEQVRWRMLPGVY